MKKSLMSRTEAAPSLGIKAHTRAVWAASKRYNQMYVKISPLVKYAKDALDQFIQAGVVGQFEEAAL